MRKAIYLRFIIIIIITALIGGLVSAIFFATENEKKAEEYVARICNIVSYQYYINSDAKYLAEVTGGERVTIIAADGTVLDDSISDPKTMENHLAREEVKYAKEGEITTAKRASQTLGEPYMYAATMTADGNIIRISHSYGGFLRSIAYLTPVILISFILVAILAIFLAGAFTKNIISPLENFADTLALGKYDELEQKNAYYEIEKIISKIKDLLKRLSDSQNEIGAQHEKINFILSNMDEGFILLDDEKNIRLCNNSAQRIFGLKTDPNMQNIVTAVRNAKIINAVDMAIAENSSTVFDLQLNNTDYSVHVSPVSSEYVGTETDKNGATILLLDVGAERKSQRQRSEFFANASHELKTPITSIMGFSEILSNNLVKQNEQKQIHERIYTESKRIGNLIDDILTISRLESGVTTNVDESIDVKKVVTEVVNSLTPRAKALGATINTECDTSYISANYRQIYELVSNLAENAIKYNKPNGQVNISVKNTADRAVITVSDTGIGIPPAAQGRIFERFYRVDTGRSKSVGGTGLGLAIVKHIVVSLGGEINLKSQVAEGTNITVSLPNN